MPRLSRKRRYLVSLTKLLNKRLQERAVRTINDDEDSLEDAVDLPVAMAIQNGFRRRYLFRKSKYRQAGDRFKLDLDGFGEDEDDHESGDHMEEEASQLPWLTEDDFYRNTECQEQVF